MEPQALRTIIQNTLKPHNLWSQNAEELLMATAANESHLGVYREQQGGPAKGIFQMEGEDFNDLYTNFLAYHPTLLAAANSLSTERTVNDLVNNDPYAVMLCRLHYYRYPDALPDSSDIEAIWALYKKRYNTPQGAATHDQFVQCYKKYVLQL